MSDLPPPPPSAEVVTTPDGADAKYPEGRTWIMLDDNPDIPPTGLSLGVNGDVIMIMPNEPVHIPNRYLEVLDHAVQSTPVRDAGQHIVEYRDKHRFPYRRVPAPAGA